MGDGKKATKRAERSLPLLRLLGYYALIIVIGALLVRYVPAAERAFVAPISPPGAGAVEDMLRQDPTVGAAPDIGTSVTDEAGRIVARYERAVTTALSAIGILAIVMPIAWIYMYTRRFRYDRALVQSVMILPLVVAGMVMIVKNSLALAFSLAGIVAAVRFRNTLKDPRDAVYIFLALGLGLAAGVQALDIAIVMSLTFNLLVLMLWKYNLAAIYGVERREGTFAMGDPSVRLGRTAAERDQLRASLESPDMDADGVLLVQGADAATLRTATESALTGNASDWEYCEQSEGMDGNIVLPVLVRFKKKGTPIDVLGELDEYWARHITSAEYLPFADKQGNGKNS
ncbi:MAG TPA: DUF4956 domain-containing protein [Longimicrobiales bacterium]|nr:DUF4956 domain-containing protein [Longimicrobiales bacterium]